MVPLKKTERQSAESLRMLVERLFASKRQRLSAMNLLASSIEAAHSLSPDRWSVTAFEGALRLVVGTVEVITLLPDWIHILIHKNAKRDGIEQWGEIQGKVPFYTVIPNSMSFNFSPEALRKVQSKIRRNHRAIIKAAAKLPVNPASKNAYSSGAIQYLSELLDRQLPHPRYFRDADSPASTWLLKWNPKTTIWRNFRNHVLSSKQGKLVKHEWSSGKTKRIKPGDRLFMLKTGPDGGLIASGIALSAPDNGRHWRENAKEALYFDIQWDTILDPQIDPLLKPRSFQSKVLKEFRWTIQGHGHQIPTETAIELEQLWVNHTGAAAKDSALFPDEIPQAEYYEGAARRILVNAYERDPAARSACLDVHGFRCHACDLNFEEFYGELGAEFIHVHHLRSLATRGKRHKVNPKRDLRPVCPNCHAMLHRPKEMLTIADLKKRIQLQRLVVKQ